jgi:hypothetical protein
MLHREHSDFQWFRERIRSLHSQGISAYSGMASLVAPSNVEPSLPKDRAEHDLPPKSYADAVVEGNDVINGTTHDRRPSMSGTSSTTAVEERTQLDEDKTLYERHLSTNRHETLTSVRPDDSHEQAPRRNGTSGPRELKRQDQDRLQTPLESGRKAGAGWQRSA